MIVLPARLKSLAVARAKDQGISFGELVRQTLPKHLDESAGPKASDPFWDNLMSYVENPTDLAARHDDYLYGGKK
jgi:hypothetical protein